MAMRMLQFRYYKDNNQNNSPMNWNWTYYCAADTFKSYSPIVSIGIQSLPGTKFYLNDSLNPIILGVSGIFELDVSNTSATINNLRIDQKSMDLIRTLDNGFLIIDIVYEEQGGLKI